jgi:hypothetical protein
MVSEERKEYFKKYREEHKEQRREYGKKYAEEHKEECNERSRIWHENHKDRHKEAIKKWNTEHIEEMREYRKKYYQEHKTDIDKHKVNRNTVYHAEQQRNRNKNLRKKFFEMYGNKCVCCGESEYIFLTMDHVQNDGNKRRERYGNNNLKEYRTAIKEYQPEIYQVLCYNCNHAKHINGGICPHKTIT